MQGVGFSLVSSSLVSLKDEVWIEEGLGLSWDVRARTCTHTHTHTHTHTLFPSLTHSLSPSLTLSPAGRGVYGTDTVSGLQPDL